MAILFGVGGVFFGWLMVARWFTCQSCWWCALLMFLCMFIAFGFAIEEEERYKAEQAKAKARAEARAKAARKVPVSARAKAHPIAHKPV